MGAMLSFLVLLFPLLLMAFMLVMERVEEPFRRGADGDYVAEFLETAQPDEVDTLVRDGFTPALARWRNRRRRLTKLLPSAGRSNRTS
jgi:hypothetical protein